MLAKIKRYSYVCITLVVINVLVHIYGQINTNIYEWGMLDPVAIIIKGQYYRIFTSMFLHLDLSHIANNMIVLFFLGDMLEREVGHLSVGIVYFMSGILAGTLSLGYKYISGSTVCSLGASGAVFGLTGLLLALVLWARGRLPGVSLQRTIAMVILSVYTGFANGNIDNAAHIGGLIGGFVVGTVFCFFSNRKKLRKREGDTL